eukprot:841817_1
MCWICASYAGKCFRGGTLNDPASVTTDDRDCYSPFVFADAIHYNYLYGYSCEDLTDIDYANVTHDISQDKCARQCANIGNRCVMIKSTDDTRCYIFDILHMNRSVIAYEDQTDNCTDHPPDW